MMGKDELDALAIENYNEICKIKLAKKCFEKL